MGKLNMAKFMYIFRGGAFVTPDLSPTQMQEHLAKWNRWVDGLTKAGHNNVGHPLGNRGNTVRARNHVTDGPYAESKDLVTGALVLEATSLDEATKLARECPIFEFGGSVEVRPLLIQEV
jgi:hypothetical protein